MKLISMTDFVLDKQRFKEDSDTAIFKITNYGNFLTQPLKLEMFVPCDEDGNVLEEPNLVLNFTNKEGYYNYDGFEKAKLKYQKAKEKVLFENYSVVKQSTYSIVVDSHGRNVWLSWNESKTIESLINEVTEVSLTPNTIKQLGL